MPALSLTPGHGIASIRLGAALYDVLTAIKKDAKRFSKLDVSYSSSRPLDLPIVVKLPENGLRLRFDGPQQRLRLIEILDLYKADLRVKSEHLIPQSESVSRLLYRRVYSLFGASYPGELILSPDGAGNSTYVVSYPGLALSFSMKAGSWSPNVDHAKMLTDSGAEVASIAVFEGKSWAEARDDLFDRPSAFPRSLGPISKHKDGHPDEIELARLVSPHEVSFDRRSTYPVTIKLNCTTAQDLVTDFGPPDAVFHRPGEVPDAATRPMRITRRRSSSVVPRSYGSTPSSVSSTNTDTYDADFEEDDGIDGPDVVRQEDQYYCYYQHGFDVLLGHASNATRRSANPHQPVVLRIIFHGNVPGSFEFNRHRRSIWSVDYTNGKTGQPNSNSRFSRIHEDLVAHFKDVWPEKDMRDGMVIVRDWAGESPSGSAILIGTDAGDEEEESSTRDSERWLKNTQLYKFPGLMFEVMHNGAISALTVYHQSY